MSNMENDDPLFQNTLQTIKTHEDKLNMLIMEYENLSDMVTCHY